MQFGCECRSQNVYWTCYLTIRLPNSAILLSARNAKAALGVIAVAQEVPQYFHKWILNDRRYRSRENLFFPPNIGMSHFAEYLYQQVSLFIFGSFNTSILSWSNCLVRCKGLRNKKCNLKEILKMCSGTVT